MNRNLRRKYCCIKSCENFTGTAEQIQMFKIPTDAAIRNKWNDFVSNCNLNNHNGMGMICMLHFEADAILGSAKRARLKPDAVPTINLAYVRPQIENICLENAINETECDESDDDEENLNSVDSSPASVVFVETLPQIEKATKRTEGGVSAKDKTNPEFVDRCNLEAKIQHLNVKLATSQQKCRELSGLVREFSKKVIKSDKIIEDLKRENQSLRNHVVKLVKNKS